VTVNGKYSHIESRHVSTHWDQIKADHEEEFPQIHLCHPGTFNMVMTDGAPYTPPDDSEYRRRAKARGRPVKRYEDGNHLSPRAKVIQMNGKTVEAWIYRGGHRDRPVLELVSRCPLAEHLAVHNGDAVTALIVEVSEGTPGMPGPPPATPGKTVKMA
jgi:hypothetical protein